jgi:hypothetical protein
MFKWFNEQGFTADMKQAKKIFPSVRPTSLEEWLMKENWHR